MHTSEFRRLLQEFSRQARAGLITERRLGLETNAATVANDLADLADTLNRRIGIAESNRMIKSEDTISFAPNRCPTCGK